LDFQLLIPLVNNEWCFKGQSLMTLMHISQIVNILEKKNCLNFFDFNGLSIKWNYLKNARGKGMWQQALRSWKFPRPNRIICPINAFLFTVTPQKPFTVMDGQECKWIFLSRNNLVTSSSEQLLPRKKTTRVFLRWMYKSWPCRFMPCHMFTVVWDLWYLVVSGCVQE